MITMQKSIKMQFLNLTIILTDLANSQCEDNLKSAAKFLIFMCFLF